ncbi:alpha-1,3-galactosidase-related protein [Mucilaginibacter celer]|nr:right-handed parallel beta-helix repeat-containing protein [Mucilaginibacter celer]
MRNLALKSLAVLCLMLISNLLQARNKPADYISIKARRTSPGNQTYFIDPVKGNDQNNGKSKIKAWKTFVPVNRLILSPGDDVSVLSPGDFHESMAVVARGSSSKPVNIKFAPGKYNFFPDGAFKTQLQISNTNDVPYGLKAIALMVDSSRFVNVASAGALINLRGKMIETYVNHSNNIKLCGLSYDYHRPTVSELTVTQLAVNYADVRVNKGDEFAVKDSVLTWIGEGWSYQPDGYWQQYNPATRELERIEIEQQQLRYVNTSENQLRIYFKQNPGFKTGLTYQNRDVTRDCAGIFIQKSKNISFNHVRIYFMHGMGVVSQFSQNLTFNHVSVKARAGRTCAAWADILHFSGCSGKIEVANSYLSAANDDAINIHGTFLKITERLSSTEVKVKFMHNQTYGFDAFSAGDSVGMVNPASLLTYQSNKLLLVQKLNDKEFMLKLSKPLPVEMQTGDVIENVTATPQVWIHHDTIEKIPTRGILLTTLRKSIIEHNVFNRTHNSAIWINDDASGWYESGAVRDVTIRNNRFFECGGPVIGTLPETKVPVKKAVHSGIKILNNKAVIKEGLFLSASANSGLRVTGNHVKSKVPVKNFDALMSIKDCFDLPKGGFKGNVLGE